MRRPALLAALLLAPAAHAATLTVQPGGSLDAAYHAAAPGDHLCLASGQFTYQRLSFDGTKAAGSSPVVIEPCMGATVTVDQIDFGNDQVGVQSADDVTVQNLTVGYVSLWGSADRDLILNGKGRSADVFGGSYDTIRGGDYGPCQAPRDGACTIRLLGDHQTIEGAHIHGATSTDLANYHVDGVFVRGCTSCTIKGSRFDGNMITNVRVQNCCGLPPNRDLQLEHNDFAKPLQGDGVSTREDAVDVDTATPGIVVKDNLIDGFVAWGTTGTGVVTGNVMTDDGCLAASYSGNLERAFSSVYRNTACPGDTLVTATAWTAAAAAWRGVVPPPPPPPVPVLMLKSFTAQTVTVAWKPIVGVTGYRLIRDGTQVATAGLAATTARFGVTWGAHTLEVAAVTPAGEGKGGLTVRGAWTTP